MANTIVMAGLGFLFWIVAARFYAEAAVGLSSAIISAISFIALLSGLGLNVSLVRFLPTAQKPIDLINSCFTLSGIVALAVAVIFIAGLSIWSPALGLIREDPIFSVAFVSIVLVWTMSTLMDFIFIGRRRADLTLFKNTIISVLKIPLPIVLILSFKTFGIVASFGLATGIAVVISLLVFLPKAQDRYKPALKIDVDTVKVVRRYSVASYLASLLSTAPAVILPIMVINILGPVQNAYFYVAWLIASLLFAMPTAVAQSLFAEGAHFDAPLKANVVRSYKFIFMLLIPAIILLLLAGKWLLLAFGAAYSANAMALLTILSISSIFVGMNSVYLTILRITDRVVELVAICGFITIAVLTASYYITPTTGIIGIGYVWLVAQGATSLYVGWQLGRGFPTVSKTPQLKIESDEDDDG
jgi:O-antigen/teichoic acid export membrane protein